MEEIHFKTVDPVSQELLRLAAREGRELNWDRWEKQQPLDGFLRLGLSCPYGCLQGPCRIDPFDSFARRGICGIDRDAMTAAMLLRISVQGALEIWADTYEMEGREEDDPGREAGPADCGDGEEIDSSDLMEAAFLLSRPAAKPERLVEQSLRLSLLSLGLAGLNNLSVPEGRRPLRAGYGLLADDSPRVAVVGQVDEDSLAVVSGMMKKAKPAAQLLSLGDWLPFAGSYLPIVSSRGEAELALVSRKFQLVLAGRRADPGVLLMAGELGIPVIEAPCLEDADMRRVLKQALAKTGKGNIQPGKNLLGQAEVLEGVSTCKASILAKNQAGFVFLGGSDSLCHPFGHLPCELARELIGRGRTVVAWGDAALWMLKQDLPVTIVEPEIGPLNYYLALKEIDQADKVLGACFLGLERARDFAVALGLAAAGLRVAVATPLPLWGSAAVRGILEDMLDEAGGSFAHFDHPVTADELLQWFAGDK